MNSLLPQRIISAPGGVIIDKFGKPAALTAIENNWYESSRWSPNRSFIWFPVQDARKDLDRYTRLELSRHARYLYKNSPFMRGLVERVVTLIVGNGFHPVFKSSNKKWNKRAKKLWKMIARNIHLGHPCSFSQYQRAVMRARVIDGECYSVKTFDNIAFQDRIQGLEAEWVGGIKGKNVAPENAEFNHNYLGGVDGFNLDEYGRVASYNIKNVDLPYLAQDIIQHYTPNRLGQYRGETMLAAAINTARDVDDILAMEKECVKDASATKDIIETASGQLDAETFRSLRYQTTNPAAVGPGQGTYPTIFSLPEDKTSKDDYYRVRFGAQPVVLRRGDKYTPYEPKRPGAAWQGFMDFLSSTICLSTAFPASVVLPINIGGTDIRRDLDIAQKVVEPIQMDLVAEFDQILEYLMLGEVQDGLLKQDLPDDWQEREWHFPPKLNVDRSQAKEDREDVARGLMTLDEYHGRYGNDADATEENVIGRAKARKKAILGAGFKSIQEYIQVLSLDSNMFKTTDRVEANAVPDATEGLTAPAPQPGAKPQPKAK